MAPSFVWHWQFFRYILTKQITQINVQISYHIQLLVHLTMTYNQYMHPRNIYRQPPDFKQLAIEFEQFRRISKMVNIFLLFICEIVPNH